MTWLSRCSVRQVMSGSQPATVGELHPLHRNALRHPLILDGLSDSASRLRPPSPFGFGAPSCSASSRLCLHVLSSFQRTGWSYRPDEAPRREVRRVPPQVFLRWGNLTILLARSSPCQPLAGVFVVFDVAKSFQRNGARRRTAEGLFEPEGLLKDPAAGRVTLGPMNIRGRVRSVNPSPSPANPRLARSARAQSSSAQPYLAALATICRVVPNWCAHSKVSKSRGHRAQHQHLHYVLSASASTRTNCVVRGGWISRTPSVGGADVVGH